MTKKQASLILYDMMMGIDPVTRERLAVDHLLKRPYIEKALHVAYNYLSDPNTRIRSRRTR